MHYWIVIFVLSFFAISFATPNYSKSMYSSPRVLWSITIICLGLFIGLRYQVGGDWPVYLRHINRMEGISLLDAILTIDEPLYALIKWLAWNTQGSDFLLNLILSTIFVIGLSAFLKTTPRPWLALCVAFPYFVVVVAMGYARQGGALGIILFAFSLINSGRISLLKYLLLISLAATIHKSSIVLAPFGLFLIKRNLFLNIIFIFTSSLVLFFVLLQEYLSTYWEVYTGLDVDSSGALIRILMVSLTSILFFLFRSRMNISNNCRAFWTAYCIGGFGLLILYFIVPSSTIVDRIGLFFLPVQLYIFSLLPDALGTYGKRNLFWTILIIIYYWLVFLIWQNFATHSAEWFPYKSLFDYLI